MLTLRPSTRDEANAIINAWHRHSPKVIGHRFAIVAEIDGQICGAAVVGRPKAQELQDAVTAEITRVATDGTRNACSLLYGACRRSWAAMGGRRLYTYTLASEPGTSLRAAEFTLDAELPARENWDGPKRRRPASTEPCPARKRWVWRR